MLIPIDLYLRIKKWAKENKMPFRAAFFFLLQKGLDPH